MSEGFAVAMKVCDTVGGLLSQRQIRRRGRQIHASGFIHPLSISSNAIIPSPNTCPGWMICAPIVSTVPMRS